MTRFHPDDDEILLYHQNKLSPEARERTEAHIGGCSACTTRFADLLRLSSLVDRPPENFQIDATTREKARNLIRNTEPRQTGEPRIRPGFRLALAGSAAFALLLTLYFLLPQGVERQFRSEDAETTVPLVLFPRDGAAVNNQTSPFRWTSLGSSIVYRFSLLEPTGQVVWRTDIRDTSITLPQSIVLQPGKTYLWRVETTLADKKLERSALHAFTYSPE